MIIIKEKGKKVTFPKYDYLFDKYNNFLKLYPYITPKIIGDWTIVLLGLKIPDIEHLNNQIELSDDVRLLVYLEKDVIAKALELYPEMVYEKVSRWDAYMDYIVSLGVRIDNKALSAIFKRCNGSLDTIKEELPRIINKCPTGNITLRDVNKNLIDNSRIYASQVIKEFLLNERYRWEHFDRLRKDIGNEISFYAMRKYLRKLVILKNKYLNNESKDDKFLVKVDSYTIGFASSVFEQANHWSELPACLLAIERRQNAYH